ncbi:MAG: hypothetical protein MI747_18425 [Desulfobacterales bacterium]|nr:hypothetical protein [Desulfobacterales bacterium]
MKKRRDIHTCRVGLVPGVQEIVLDLANGPITIIHNLREVGGQSHMRK